MNRINIFTHVNRTLQDSYVTLKRFLFVVQFVTCEVSTMCYAVSFDKKLA